MIRNYLTLAWRNLFKNKIYSVINILGLAAGMAVAMLIALFVLPSSTVVDRLSLYLIPLQLAVLPRVAYLFGARNLGRFLVVVYAALVLFVWLNFAVHAEYWLPYQIYPIFG